MNLDIHYDSGAITGFTVKIDKYNKIYCRGDITTYVKDGVTHNLQGRVDLLKVVKTFSTIFLDRNSGTGYNCLKAYLFIVI